MIMKIVFMKMMTKTILKRNSTDVVAREQIVYNKRAWYCCGSSHHVAIYYWEQCIQY